MYKIFPSIILFTCICCKLYAQVNYTANTPGAVPPYNTPFLYGSNMGIYQTWTNIGIADIAAGNPAKNVKGAGIKSLHQPLPERFLEDWGYTISVNDFNHYNAVGIKDMTIYLELPTDAHTDQTTYPGCSYPSGIWSNLYEPVWDGGANGTPVNENNYFALYVYKTMMIYKPWVKFWEVVNEPDFDYGTNGWRSPEDPWGWWNRTPEPCELANLRAPVYRYIHMLRILYDVVKTVDPSAYVSMGGVGYPSFLDVILRNSDNPDGGTITSQYPNNGGAYFDCVSFHHYPIYDLGYFDNNGNLQYRRHSDAALDKYLERKNDLAAVLSKRGYNDTLYPKKIFICTENNVPNKAYGDYIGSDEAQLNYVIKALAASQANDIRQYYIFSIGDSKDTWVQSDSPFDNVGLYKNLNGKGPGNDNNGSYNQEYNSSGIAYKTFSDLLYGYKADTQRIKMLNLPANVRGVAFKGPVGDYQYVLWAVTTTDNSEAANAIYSFPAEMNMPPNVYQRSWNYSQTLSSPLTSSASIALTGTPSFVSSPLVVAALNPAAPANTPVTDFKWSLYPNPVKDQVTLKLHLKRNDAFSVNIINTSGQEQLRIADKIYLAGDNYVRINIPVSMSNGLYYCRFRNSTGKIEQTVKFVVQR